MYVRYRSCRLSVRVALRLRLAQAEAEPWRLRWYCPCDRSKTYAVAQWTYIDILTGPKGILPYSAESKDQVPCQVIQLSFPFQQELPKVPDILGAVPQK